MTSSQRQSLENAFVNPSGGRLNRRSFLERSLALGLSSSTTIALLDACGSQSSTGSSTQQPVTLKLLHWNKADYGPAVEEMNRRFHAENPAITVQYENIPTDQYETVLKARLAGGDAPDVFGAHDIKPYAKAGYLMDLSKEAWVPFMYDAAIASNSYHGKVYALSMNQNVIGVVYNRKIFSDLGLSVPATWDEFLQVCQKIKSAGIVPLALGIKDQWVTQLVPYGMTGSALYPNDPTFDQNVLAGKASFASSAWVKIMQDYLDLNKRGFFNQSPLGVTYDQSTQLVALGKAAMIAQGDWVVPAVKQANPAINLGMFPSPYVTQAGQKTVVLSGVGPYVAISAATRHPNEARKYVAFCARPDIAALYLKKGGSIPALKNVPGKPDPALTEMQQYISKGTHVFPDSNWAPGVQNVFLKDIQSLFSGTMTVQAMLQEMDKTSEQNRSQVI